MSKKRLFVALALPEGVKNELEKAVEGIRAEVDPSIRFMDRTTWHITLVFLGDQTDDETHLINQALAETAQMFESPHIRFEKIVYGPVGRTPRMIWLVADRETSNAIAAIKDDLERRLFENGIRFEQEHRQFTAHVTLARFTALNRESLPELDRPFARTFEVPSLDLMESRLQRSGAEYEALSTFDFGGENS